MVTWADIRRARELLGWVPEVSIQEGIRRTVAWYSENREWAKDLVLVSGGENSELSYCSLEYRGLVRIRAMTESRSRRLWSSSGEAGSYRYNGWAMCLGLEAISAMGTIYAQSAARSIHSPSIFRSSTSMASNSLAAYHKDERLAPLRACPFQDGAGQLHLAHLDRGYVASFHRTDGVHPLPVVGLPCIGYVDESRSGVAPADSSTSYTKENCPYVTFAGSGRWAWV